MHHPPDIDVLLGFDVEDQERKLLHWPKTDPSKAWFIPIFGRATTRKLGNEIDRVIKVLQKINGYIGAGRCQVMAARTIEIVLGQDARDNRLTSHFFDLMRRRIS